MRQPAGLGRRWAHGWWSPVSLAGGHARALPPAFTRREPSRSPAARAASSPVGRGFEAVAERLIVGPILKTLVFSTTPEKTREWVDSICATWDFNAIVPAVSRPPRTTQAPPTKARAARRRHAAPPGASGGSRPCTLGAVPPSQGSAGGPLPGGCLG